MLLLPLLLATAISAAPVHEHFDLEETALVPPLVVDAVRFQTVEGNLNARDQQKQWLIKTADDFGLVPRDAGSVIEVDLPGPQGAPVLGLIVHGDVVPVEPERWAFPPFEGRIDNGIIYGRGVADDKSPMVVALLAMRALKESGIARTHTIRLLVGSDEESGSTDMTEYLKTHQPPDYSLVLDSEFPVVVGEKAWNSLSVTTPLTERPDSKLPYKVVSLDAGLATSIVPDRAAIVLEWKSGESNWRPLLKYLSNICPAEGTRLLTTAQGNRLNLEMSGHAAHAGVNLEGGRNAVVSLASLLQGKLPPGGAADLLEFARRAGSDLYGGGLGITDRDPLWGRYAVNVATIKPADNGQYTLTINVRRIPPLIGPQLKQKLEKFVADFNKSEGSALVAGGFFDDEPLAFDPQSKIVKRLLADYERATGQHLPPGISGGGTYAKRVPNAIAFGMWFPGEPYPGHDVDEKESISDIRKSAHVLIEALVDIATGPKIIDPFKK